MAQPQQHYPPRVFSPPQGAGSPHVPYPSGPPAPKRPRLSPNGQSPYGSPNMANISLPNQVFSAPYYGAQTNGAHTGHNYSMSHSFGSTSTYNPSPTYNSMNTPAPSSAQSPPTTTPSSTLNVMGPPGRPDNRPTDLNELGDVLFGAGVDLREEEAALLRSKDNTTTTLSFEDQLREASGVNVNAKYPFSRDNFYSQNHLGDRGTFFGAGTLNQPAQQEQSAEDLEESKRKKALKENAQIKQYHLNKPFLQTWNLQRKVQKETNRLHVQLPLKDSELLKPTQPRVAPQQITVHGPDGHDVVKLVKGEPLLLLKNTFGDILSLMSLATEERLRNLIEDAATLARGRRIGSHGLVPQDLADLAAKNVEGEAAATLPTPSNSAVSPLENPLKRSYTEMNQPLTPISNNSYSRSAPNAIAQALQKVSQAERAAEEIRLAKRRKRTEATDGSRAGSLSLGPSEPGTPGTLGEVAPDLSMKKSALKNQKKVPSDAQAFAASNKTLSMALGLGGAGGKKLSWMTKDTGPSNPFLAKPATTPQKAAGTANGIGSTLPKNRTYGDFREDGDDGLGIQLRDVISVLEHDGKEKKALQSAYCRLGTIQGKQ